MGRLSIRVRAGTFFADYHELVQTIEEFYNLIDLAVGGTGWCFPEDVGKKPWFDDSACA
jgi:hypothetical protein